VNRWKHKDVEKFTFPYLSVSELLNALAALVEGVEWLSVNA
jgi:hypothetical protein